MIRLLPALLLASAPALPAQATDQRVYQFEDLQLAIELPELEDLRSSPVSGDQLRGRWGGKLGAHQVLITLWSVPRQEWGLTDPVEVIDNIAFNARRSEGGEDFEFDQRSLLAGPFGTLPYAGFAVSSDWKGTEKIRLHYYLGGLAEERGYSLRVAVEPPPDEAVRERLMTFLSTGVRYSGPGEDPAWTDEEAEARWERDRPEELQGKLKIFRTEHYLIFTDSSSGKLFGKKMEECYDRIQQTYPFPEIEGRKLMPVFLFRTKEEYVDYYVKIAGNTKAAAAESKGHSYRDYYATYYDAPNDPVHVHEATHQIFSNRLGLSGGGSWFQEGVAEYMSTSHNERKAFAKGAAKRGGFTPFREFVEIPSLLGSAKGQKDVKGGSVAGKRYTQAASIIAFLRESDFGAEKFPDFLTAVGGAERGRKGVERAIQGVYGVGLEQLEAEWVAYWKKAR
ncbi:MAG: hypothetical protein H8E31_01530 [Planctomycetes bacterium]|nr:hypothetical protein [Planctomycetota bacterium]